MGLRSQDSSMFQPKYLVANGLLISSPTPQRQEESKMVIDSYAAYLKNGVRGSDSR